MLTRYNRRWPGCNASAPTRTGEELRRRRTIPAPGEPGDETWGGVPPFEERKHVGAGTAPSHDPELDRWYCRRACCDAPEDGVDL